jgi:hypothetical protein
MGRLGVGLLEPEAEDGRDDEPGGGHDQGILQLEAAIDEVPAATGERDSRFGARLGHAMIPFPTQDSSAGTT